MHVGIHLPSPTECTTPRVTTNADYRLWGMMMCQSGLIYYHKGALVGHADKGKICLCGGGGIRNVFLSAAQFYCEPRIALKNKVY